MVVPVGIVGVVGAGTMGAGIAQSALEAGYAVVITDVDAAAIERGRARVRAGLDRRVRRLGIDAGRAATWVAERMAGLTDAPTLIELVARDPGLIIEAAIEDLAAKQTIFRTLDAIAPGGTVLATNTSALSVTEIAAATNDPGRVLGLHFFNPAPVMALVEVVAGSKTDPSVAQRALELMTTWGKVPVRTADSPGFIVNRVNRPFTLEALAILADERASVVAIDDAIRAAGFPMGPFELMDLVGIDVNLAAARGVYAGFSALGDPLAERFRPSPIQERLVAAGQLGRKTNLGFHAYDGSGARLGPAPDFIAGPGRAGGIAAPEIARRIILAIVNEAYRAVGDGIASEADVDVAMRLGAGHPIGPFERAKDLGGPSAIRAGLREYSGGGPRFHPAAGLTATIRT